MREQFSPDETPEFRDIEVEELRAVLDELHRDLGPEVVIAESRITVEEIAEATDMPLAKVNEAVRRVREARMAEVLRELEEPTYRVERPGQTPVDPLFAQRFTRDNFPNLLDSATSTPPKKREVPRTVHEHITDHLATLMAVLVVLVFVALLVVILARGLG